MRKSIWKSFFIGLALILTSGYEISVDAHPGRTDANSGHYGTKIRKNSILIVELTVQDGGLLQTIRKARETREKYEAATKKQTYTSPSSIQTDSIRTIEPQSSKNPNAHLKSGVLYMDNAEYRKAIKSFNLAIALNSKFVEAYQNRATCYGKLENNAKALEDFSTAIKIKPGDSSLYLFRGYLLFKMRQESWACDDFKKACNLGDCFSLDWMNSKGKCQ
jgi:tetratricopeptide (TPR) repeat protein